MKPEEWLDALFVLSWIGSCVLCAWKWDRGWMFRYLPISYAFVIGCVLAALDFAGPGLERAAETIFVSTLVGAGFWLSIWIETRRDKRDAGPNDIPEKVG